MEDCIFCKIANKKVPADFLFENDDLIAIKDIKPAAPVHILIMPKLHVESIMKFEEENRELASQIIFIAKEIAEKMKLTGYKLVFNVGKDGGQVIPHLHLHLLAGWKNQKLIDQLPHPDLDRE